MKTLLAFTLAVTLMAAPRTPPVRVRELPTTRTIDFPFGAWALCAGGISLPSAVCYSGMPEYFLVVTFALNPDGTTGAILSQEIIEIEL